MNTRPVSEKKIVASVTYTSSDVLLDDRHQEAIHRVEQVEPVDAFHRGNESAGKWAWAVSEARGSYATTPAVDRWAIAAGSYNPTA